MGSQVDAVAAHYIAHWGVPTDIRPRHLSGIGPFALFEFPPRGTRRTWRYATNGMSALVQTPPEGGRAPRTELYACTSQRTPWVDDLLGAIASYPHDYGTSLSEGDTIGVGQPIDRSCSCFTGILLAPPGPMERTIGLVGSVPEDILVHQVVGILPSELRFARHRGGGELWSRLVNLGELLLDIPRSASVSST